MFVKKKTGKSTLIHVAAEATTDMAEEIKRRLEQINTPLPTDELENAIINALTHPVWGKRLCKNVVVEWDNDPSVVKVHYVGYGITYVKRAELDVIVCDGKGYSVEAEVEQYSTPVGDFVHSFKPIDVGEM